MAQAGLLGCFYILITLAMDSRLSEAVGGAYLPTFMWMGAAVLGLLSLILILYMVLQYIRIGSGTNDLVIREYRLDELIRDAVRKQAGQFVEKRLRFCYLPTDATVITDRKWFSCILDQLLSNAVKYTQSGSVSVTVKDGFLSVSDTGIGIMPEDLPRIFEKGYTGANGRLEQKSSGLGLYLAKKAARSARSHFKRRKYRGKGQYLHAGSV